MTMISRTTRRMPTIVQIDVHTLPPIIPCIEQLLSFDVQCQRRDYETADTADDRWALPPVTHPILVVRAFGARQAPLSPEEIDRGIDEQLHDERRKQPS